jgi:hypothetical protein
VSQVSEDELSEIIACALHYNGPVLNRERVDFAFAKVRADIIVREFKHRGLVVCREEVWLESSFSPGCRSPDRLRPVCNRTDRLVR